MMSLTIGRRKVVSAGIAAVVAIGLGTGVWHNAAAQSSTKSSRQAAGVIVGANEQLALSITNTSNGSLPAVLKVTGGNGNPILHEDVMLEPGATMMPGLISGGEIAGEDSTEWPIYGQPVSVSLSFKDSSGPAPILSVATLDADGEGARAWPIYGITDNTRDGLKPAG